ncbi:MAG: murein biosynthesis integral membrane protein MurJ [Candidatus Abawacabacteria bacterium RBG_16_42_10]|uniref:Probable lipid II flippase MurJ n=1 Tax=Candidatus Abawacabacteria bacterium RBG_16_42_10 TaxID=1817814 RepID=A0A1F4XJP2_9BACT|nr:MAG: murein biosynthesis integral membrane protein MurJ [Candidatus Abawacabacteria bacterium RBG_16_42_10]
MAHQNPLKLLKRIITSASLLLAASSLISRGLGLIRDRLLTHSFGATRAEGGISELDAYYAAFQLPDLLYQILILGTISACFVPFFIDAYKKDEKAAWKLANNTMTSILLLMIILVIGSFIFSKQILGLFTVGLPTDAQKLALTLTHIMLLSPLFFSFSAITGAISHSLKRFVAFAIAPIIYNLSIIAGILFLTPYYGIHGVSIGVVIGALLHACVQFYSALKGGFRPQFFLDWENKDFLQMVRSALPRILSLAVSRINIVVDTALASLLMAGSITILNLAQNMQSLPMGVVGVSIAVASFPIFADLASEKNQQKLHELLCKKTRKIIYVLLPLTIITILLRTEIVRLLFGSGRFNWVDTITTGDTLGLFAISFIAQSLLPVLTRIFYAFKNTVSPLYISFISIIVNVVFSVMFIFLIKGEVEYLGLSFTIASFVQLCLMLYHMNKKYQLTIFEPHDTVFYVKTLFATIVMGIIAQATKVSSGLLFDPLDTFVKVLGKVSLVVAISLVVYLLVQAFLKNSANKVLLADYKQVQSSER